MTSENTFLGHPIGLRTLFFTEMWERLSYYGMRALLLLFLVDNVKGGFGLPDTTAAAIYGLYTAAVYLVALPGGWIADRILGQRKAVFYGGCIIAMGHFSMALGPEWSFYMGLVLIITGTGLLKPNVSTMVGDLYPEGGARRDAAFSIFYTGINTGAFFGPFLCGYLAKEFNWHYGFAVAGVGMVLGLIQYRAGWKHLGDAGQLKNVTDQERSTATGALVKGGIAVVVLLGGVFAMGFGAEQIAHAMGVFIATVMFGYFFFQIFFGGFSGEETKRIWVILLLCVMIAIFWAGAEQAGSSLNLFAQRLTNLNVMGFDMPAAWFQSANPLFVIMLAPIFGWLWIKLGSREPSLPAKFAYGLLQLAICFAVMVWASTYVGDLNAPNKVSVGWLTLTYFIMTTAELCVSPVGLSSVTKLAPRKIAGQMMGLWFMSSSLGDLIAGLAAGQMHNLGLVQLFGSVSVIAAIAGIIMLLLCPPVKRLMGGVR